MSELRFWLLLLLAAIGIAFAVVNLAKSVAAMDEGSIGQVITIHGTDEDGQPVVIETTGSYR